MYIEFKWTNINKDLDEILVRRSEDRESVKTAPVLQTLSGQAEVMTDEDVERDKVYYYELEFKRGTDSVRSRIYELTATFSTGPGTQVLKAGDMDSGFFGVESFDACFDISNLSNYIRSKLSGIPAGDLPFMSDVVKYAYRGKVCFLVRPSTGIPNFILSSLRSAGMTMGDDQIHNGVLHNARFEDRGNQYRFRLVQTGIGNFPLGTSTYAHQPSWFLNNIDNEYTRVLARLKPKGYTEFSRFGPHLSFESTLGNVLNGEPNSIPFGQGREVFIENTAVVRDHSIVLELI